MIKALEIKRIMKYGPQAHVDLSRLAIYYLARELMNPSEVLNDKGTYISLAADVLRRFGICTEADWPFDLSKVTVPPSWRAMRKAYVHKITAWYKIKSSGANRVEDVIEALAAGYPVVYGTKVGSNWTKYTGKDPIGLPSDVLGGHATVLVGWDPARNLFIGENSWGNWGLNGFYELREEVISDDSSRDFIVIQAPWE
jgi:C1A family cysteine protease